MRPEGSARTLLSVDPGEPRSGAGTPDVYKLNGKETSCTMRASGEASTLFPELPAAGIRFDVVFETASGWVLAVTGRSLASLDEINRFRQPILQAYRNNVWKPDFALITGIATASKMTLIVSSSGNTKLMLSASGAVAQTALTAASLTADVSIAAVNEQVENWIFDTPSPIGCTGIRVRDPWWSWARPDIEDLQDIAPTLDPATASDDEFWDDLDF